MGGALKQAGFNDIRFVDAMTNYISDAELAQIIQDHQPGCGDGDGNYADEGLTNLKPPLKIAKAMCPDVVTVDGRHSPHLHVPGGAGGKLPGLISLFAAKGEEISAQPDACHCRRETPPGFVNLSSVWPIWMTTATWSRLLPIHPFETSTP